MIGMTKFQVEQDMGNVLVSLGEEQNHGLGTPHNSFVSRIKMILCRRKGVMRS
jgi:hypothetical protein